MKKKQNNESKIENSLDTSNIDSSEQGVAVIKEKPSIWQKIWKGFIGFWTSKTTKEMTQYILKRLVLLIFTFLVIFLICFRYFASFS